MKVNKSIKKLVYFVEINGKRGALLRHVIFPWNYFRGIAICLEHNNRYLHKTKRHGR